MNCCSCPRSQSLLTPCVSCDNDCTPEYAFKHRGRILTLCRVCVLLEETRVKLLRQGRGPAQTEPVAEALRETIEFCEEVVPPEAAMPPKAKPTGKAKRA